MTSEKWLDIFKKAMEGDMHLQSMLARYSHLIDTRREKEYMRTLVYNNMAHRLLPLFLNLIQYGKSMAAQTVQLHNPNMGFDVADTLP